VAGKVAAQAVDRFLAGAEFVIHPCRGIGNVASASSGRTQDAAFIVLVAVRPRTERDHATSARKMICVKCEALVAVNQANVTFSISRSI
jgi:hypothetical protein